MPTFRESCSPLHQGEKQSDTELFLGAVSFYITLVEVVERKKRIMDGEEGGNGENRSVFKSLLLNRENGFPYFIYVVAYLYLNC